VGSGHELVHEKDLEGRGCSFDVDGERLERFD